MKNKKNISTLTLTALTIGSMAHASSIEIKSTDAKDFSISTIERSITVDRTDGRLNVVEVDLGGSTDISSAAEPSELLLTLFKDGEMINLAATFDLGRIYSLRSAKMKDKNTVQIEVQVKDIMLKSSIKKITVNIADLRAKVINPGKIDIEFGTLNLDSKVISSEKLGID